MLRIFTIIWAVFSTVASCVFIVDVFKKNKCDRETVFCILFYGITAILMWMWV